MTHSEPNYIYLDTQYIYGEREYVFTMFGFYIQDMMSIMWPFTKKSLVGNVYFFSELPTHLMIQQQRNKCAVTSLSKEHAGSPSRYQIGRHHYLGQ